MADELAALYRLFSWLSAGFPIGAFSYSHGLEGAVESGRVFDHASLQAWIAAILAHGSGRLDADILRDAYRAAAACDVTALAEVNRRGAAYRATAELALESKQQGEAFQATVQAAWGVALHPDPPPGSAKREGPAPVTREGEGSTGGNVCYAAAVGAVTARARIPLENALVAYLQAMAANLVSAALRLGVIGQTDGQRILAALEPLIIGAVNTALVRDPADFGAATFAVDLTSMAHETQYSRLFRS